MKTLAFLDRPAPVVSLRICFVGLMTSLAATACGDPPRRFTEPMALGGQTVPPEVLDQGARIYGLYCSSCHGADGSGRAAASRSLDTPPRDFREAAFRYVSGPEGSLPSDADLEETIRHGRPGTGMPAWDGLPAEDIHAVIQFIKTFSPRWAHEAPVVTPTTPAITSARKLGEG